MSSIWSHLRVVPLCAVLCACGGGDSDSAPQSTTVYASLEALQCMSTIVRPLSSLALTLSTNGVTVVTKSCGNDGNAHVTVCGVPDGSIGIFSIPATQAPTAHTLGFAPLSDLPNARTDACPAGGN